MRVLIDAEVVHGHYCESVLGVATDLTASAAVLFERLVVHDSLYLDLDGHIEQEWRNLVDADWFEAWLGDLVANGRVFRVKPETCTVLLRYLAVNFGFPSTSGDKWYIRTGKAACGQGEHAVLVSEDGHFHEPGCARARRQRLLTNSQGAMARYLSRREGILVVSVCQHADLC